MVIAGLYGGIKDRGRDWKTLYIDRYFDGGNKQVARVVDGHELRDALSALDGGREVARLVGAVHPRKELGLHVGEATQDAIAAARAVDQVVLVEAGEDRELGVDLTDGADDLTRVADGVDRVLDAADVRVRSGEPGHELGRQVGASARREVVQHDRQVGGVRDAAKVLLGSVVGGPEVVRRDRQDRVGTGLLGMAREVEDVVVGGVTHADEDLHAAGDPLDGKVDDRLLVLEAHAVELADAAKQKHAVDARVGQVVQVSAPQLVVDLPIIVGNGDGGAEDSLKHVSLAFRGHTPTNPCTAEKDLEVVGLDGVIVEDTLLLGIGEDVGVLDEAIEVLVVELGEDTGGVGAPDDLVGAQDVLRHRDVLERGGIRVGLGSDVPGQRGEIDPDVIVGEVRKRALEDVAVIKGRGEQVADDNVQAGVLLGQAIYGLGLAAGLVGAADVEHQSGVLDLGDPVDEDRHLGAVDREIAVVAGKAAAHRDLELEDVGVQIVDEVLEDLLGAAAEGVEHDRGFEAVRVLLGAFHGVLVLQAVQDALQQDGLLDVVFVHDVHEGLNEVLLVSLALGDDTELFAGGPATVAVAQGAQLSGLAHGADVVKDVGVCVDLLHFVLLTSNNV